jgi:hypothetical protein
MVVEIADGVDSAEPEPVPNDGVIRVFGALLRRLVSSSENSGSSNSLGSIPASIEEMGVKGRVSGRDSIVSPVWCRRDGLWRCIWKIRCTFVLFIRFIILLSSLFKTIA